MINDHLVNKLVTCSQRTKSSMEFGGVPIKSVISNSNFCLNYKGFGLGIIILTILMALFILLYA